MFFSLIPQNQLKLHWWIGFVNLQCVRLSLEGIHEGPQKSAPCTKTREGPEVTGVRGHRGRAARIISEEGENTRARGRGGALSEVNSSRFKFRMSFFT